jgi:hemerythrin
MKLDWIDPLSTGIELVDQQHRKLFALYNAAAAQPESELNLPGLLDELAAYAATHFADEEQYMRTLGFPEDEYNLHVVLHADFGRKLAELDGAPVYQILDYIQEWLFRHIMTVDRRIGEFVRKAQKAVC